MGCGKIRIRQREKLLKKAILIAACVAGLLIGPLSMLAGALPAYSTKEKKACNYCHLNSAGGGARGFRGIYYSAKKLSFKGFVEKTQAIKAGVKAGAMGKDSKPTKKYKP